MSEADHCAVLLPVPLSVDVDVSVFEADNVLLLNGEERLSEREFVWETDVVVECVDVGLTVVDALPDSSLVDDALLLALVEESMVREWTVREVVLDRLRPTVSVLSKVSVRDGVPTD